MMFVAIVNGHSPIVYAFVGENGKTQSVNGTCYLELLKEVIWPELRYTATGNWPAHSPDLNPLDFHFWGEAQQQVYQEHPETIESLIEYGKNFAARYESSMIKNLAARYEGSIMKRVAANVLKRANNASTPTVDTSSTFLNNSL